MKLKAGEQERYCAYEDGLTDQQLIDTFALDLRWCSDDSTLSRWTNFQATTVGDEDVATVQCKGDEKPSNNVQVKLVQDKAMLGIRVCLEEEIGLDFIQLVRSICRSFKESKNSFV